MDWLQTVIIAIVEGLTEFLPVSSTGHMIITQNLLGIEQGDPFVHAFTFIIQFGAILSVVCLYWKQFFQLDHTPAPEGSSAFGRLKHKYRFYWLLFIGVLPAVIIGLLAKKSGLLDWLLDSVEVVAIMLVVGGVFMLFCDRLFNKGSDANQVNERRAFNIGLYQCISVIPGVSRSMATIVGGMTQGLTRKRAAEFSFFLHKFQHVQNWKDSDVLYEPLAQHYGLETGWLDITSDFNTALFFATCYWDGKQWLPLSKKQTERDENHKYGMIFHMPSNRMPMRWLDALDKLEPWKDEPIDDGNGHVRYERLAYPL